MIDVYSIDRLLEEGRLFKTERSSWYFDKANRVLIFPTPEEALNFSGKFGGYVFHTENLQILSETKVVMKQPSSNIQEHQFREVDELPKASGETWLIFNPLAFGKLEGYMNERKIEYHIK
jgi:hypothetical protein